MKTDRKELARIRRKLKNTIKTIGILADMSSDRQVRGVLFWQSCDAMNDAIILAAKLESILMNGTFANRITTA